MLGFLIGGESPKAYQQKCGYEGKLHIRKLFEVFEQYRIVVVYVLSFVVEHQLYWSVFGAEAGNLFPEKLGFVFGYVIDIHVIDDIAVAIGDDGGYYFVAFYYLPDELEVEVIVGVYRIETLHCLCPYLHFASFFTGKFPRQIVGYE